MDAKDSYVICDFKENGKEFLFFRTVSLPPALYDSLFFKSSPNIKKNFLYFCKKYISYRLNERIYNL